MIGMTWRQKTLSLILKESVDLINIGASGRGFCEKTQEFNINYYYSVCSINYI